MSKTIIQLVESALWPVAGVKPPSSIESTTDQQQLKLRYIVEEVARNLRDEIITVPQKRYYSFDLESGRSKYNLPQDFHELIARSVYDDDADWQVWGPHPDGTWTYLDVKGYGQSRVNFRIWGGDTNPNSPEGQFEVLDTPSSSGLTIRLEYTTKTLFTPPYWLPSTVYGSTGVQAFNAGKIYEVSSTGTSGTTGPVHTSGTATDGSVDWDFVAAPKESISAASGGDEELCVFDDNLMILGIRLGYLEGTSMDTSKWQMQFEAAKKKAAFRYKGPRSGRFGGSNLPRWQVFPDGNWSFS